MDPTKQLKRVIENNIVLQNYTANNYRIILELLLELTYPYLLLDLEIHFLPPEVITIRFLNIQYITMLEPIF